MSKTTCHSRLPLSPINTTPDIELANSMENPLDPRRTSALSDKRIHNVNYVRHVLRRFFGTYNRKSSPAVADEATPEQLPTLNLLSENSASPVLIHLSLEYEKQTKFSGNKIVCRTTEENMRFCV